MKAKVSKRGVLIPKDLLSGASEVEIRREERRVVISPVYKEDPILGLGREPVECGVPDASEHHDRYLYDGDK